MKAIKYITYLAVFFISLAAFSQEGGKHAEPLVEQFKADLTKYDATLEEVRKAHTNGQVENDFLN